MLCGRATFLRCFVDFASRLLAIDTQEAESVDGAICAGVYKFIQGAVKMMCMDAYASIERMLRPYCTVCGFKTVTTCDLYVTDMSCSAR